MFSNLSERFSSIVQNLTGRGRLTEENIKDALREVRNSLLEADVALLVVNKFIDDVQSKAVGQEVMKSVRPGDAFIKVVYDELVLVLGEERETLNLKVQPPVIILMAGLQGSGKTTTVAKLAKWLKDSEHKKVLVASADVYRPAAMEQLHILANQVGVEYFAVQNDAPNTAQDPVTIAQEALKKAKLQFMDVVILDTAGRLHIDKEMMDEISDIHKALNPHETLLVVDSMMGQDAANTAKVFSETVPLTGVVLTKADGDARGGAALSMRVITQKPIKFIGSGEKIDALEPFYPERIASRILGMGDIITLVEEARRKIDKEKADKLAKKIQKGRAFDFEDFRGQLQQLRKMGGMASFLSKMPGVTASQLQKFDTSAVTKMESIINSMTIRERRFPAVIKGSHKQRIASGSGTEVQDVNRLLRQFEQMQKMMKKMKGGKMMQMMKQLQGVLPEGMV